MSSVCSKYFFKFPSRYFLLSGDNNIKFEFKMTELALADVVIGSYSDGKEAPAVYHYKAAEKKAEAVLSEINPSYILRH